VCSRGTKDFCQIAVEVFCYRPLKSEQRSEIKRATSFPMYRLSGGILNGEVLSSPRRLLLSLGAALAHYSREARLTFPEALAP